MQSDRSATRGVLRRWHIIDEGRPSSVHGETDEVVGPGIERGMETEERISLILHFARGESALPMEVDLRLVIGGETPLCPQEGRTKGQDQKDVAQFGHLSVTKILIAL